MAKILINPSWHSNLAGSMPTTAMTAALTCMFATDGQLLAACTALLNPHGRYHNYHRHHLEDALRDAAGLELTANVSHHLTPALGGRNLTPSEP
jgi:hypothetical protein